MKSIFYLGALSSILLTGAIANAQDSPSSSTTPSPNNSSIQVNPSEPVQQPGTVLDSNSGSRQFFQQGREQLYFLPEEKSEPILEVDEEVEAETEKSKPQIEKTQEQE